MPQLRHVAVTTHDVAKTATFVFGPGISVPLAERPTPRDF